MGVTQDIEFEERLQQEVTRETQRLRAQLNEATEEKKAMQELLDFYNAAREAPISPPRWVREAKKKSGHVGIVVAQLTDTHFDEVVQPAEVMGYNAYNRDIARRRLRTWSEKVVTLPRDYVRGLSIEGLFVPATGDIFTGDIHPELKESNETKLLASVLEWMEPMITVLESLEKEYPSVYVAAVVGNHGRLSMKPVFKGRVHDNVEWLYWSVIRDRLADRGSKVQVDVSTSPDLAVPIYGRTHLLTHGDQFRGGTGISGAYAPLALGQHRKNVRQIAMGDPMQLMVMGHFHQLLDLPGIVMGGSMKGYDEYAFNLNLRPELAGQMMWITTPERGKTITIPVILQDREAEGW